MIVSAFSNDWTLLYPCVHKFVSPTDIRSFSTIKCCLATVQKFVYLLDTIRDSHFVFCIPSLLSMRLIMFSSCFWCVYSEDIASEMHIAVSVLYVWNCSDIERLHFPVVIVSYWCWSVCSTLFYIVIGLYVFACFVVYRLRFHNFRCFVFMAFSWLP